jgi:hypothetical protein
MNIANAGRLHPAVFCASLNKKQVMGIYPDLRWSINQEAQRRSSQALVFDENMLMTSTPDVVEVVEAPQAFEDTLESGQIGTKDLQNHDRRVQLFSDDMLQFHESSLSGKRVFCNRNCRVMISLL